MFDYIVVVVTDDSDARKLACTPFRTDVLRDSIFVPVYESDWHGRAGNGLGTLFAIENASKAIGHDLVEEVKRGKSVLIVHTAGEGTRNLLTRTVKNKALIEVPKLTLLEGVIKQFQNYALPARILVTWGDQFLLFADRAEDIRACAEKTHVMLFGLKTELTEEIASTYGIQIVRSADADADTGAAEDDGCELLDFEDTRNYEVAKLLVEKWGGEVMVNMGMFALSGVAAERMLDAFSDALAAREGMFNSDELWQTWISPEYEASDWLRERAERIKNELARTEPRALIRSYPLSEKTIWEDFGTNENYYRSMMKLLGDDDAGRGLRDFLGVEVCAVAGGCDVSRSIYEHVEFEEGTVKESVVVHSRANYAELEQSCVFNSTLNRIKGKRCIVYNVVDEEELDVEDCVVADVFHPLKGKIRLTIRIGRERGAKNRWWHTCLPENEFSLSDVAELLKGVSDAEKEDTKQRFECVAKTLIAGDKALQSAVERPFTIRPFVEPKPWGYELWCVSPRNYAELDQEALEHDLTLDDLTLLFPEQLLGSGAPSSDRFPLIIKIIRADENLSVQVHPDDTYASLIGDVFGKEEAWFVLEAKKEAKIYLGFTSEQPLSYLHAFDAHLGDTYHIPAGVIHALGAGTRVYEISTASERTFRLYDYGRGRKLHLKDAMAVLKLDEKARGRDLKKAPELLRKEAGLGDYRLLRGDNFELRLLKVDGDVNVGTGGRLCVVTGVQGEVTLKTKAIERELRPPETVVVPACVEDFKLDGNGEVIYALTRIHSMTFDDFWRKIKYELQEEKIIRNWTKDKGYLGRGDFAAVSRENYIECYPPDAENPQKVPRNDFQIVYENWQNYLHGRITRHQLRDQSRFTKYIISIIHQFEHLI